MLTLVALPIFVSQDALVGHHQQIPAAMEVGSSSDTVPVYVIHGPPGGATEKYISIFRYAPHFD